MTSELRSAEEIQKEISEMRVQIIDIQKQLRELSSDFINLLTELEERIIAQTEASDE